MESPPIDVQATPVPSFKITRVLGFLLKFWWIPLITVVLALGAAAAYIYYKPPTFVSRARMWETGKLRLPEGGFFTEDVQTFVGTQTELLKSEAMRDLALARLRSASNSVPIPRGKDGKPLPIDIRVSQSSKSSVFSLEATGSQAPYTRAYLDALMLVYFEYKKNVRRVISGDTLASVSEQAERSERDLKVEQDILTRYQQTNNLAILLEEGTIAGGYLARLRTQLSDLELEERLLRATAEAVAAPGTNSSALVSDVTLLTGSGNNNPMQLERQSAIKELEILKIQREKLSKNLRPKHPKIVRLDADIDRADKLLEIFRRQNREQLAASQESIRLKIDNVKTSIKEWESKVTVANFKIAEAENLKLNVQRAQQNYERLANLVQDVGIGRGIDTDTLSILEYAAPPVRSYTQEISTAGLAGFGGFGLGIGIIFLIAIRDDRFTSINDVREKLGDAVVAQVPEVRQLGGQTALLAAHGDDNYMYTESYRNLRSALLFLATDGVRPKVVLVTSALPSEGKSTVSVNLARTLAMGGSRVLLVDGDLRRGTLHHIFKTAPGPGLSELLNNQAGLKDVLQTNSLPNLRFITSGERIINAGDLFLGPEFAAHLEQWRKDFDYVIIDSSPIFAADDAATLAPKVDGTLLVVRNRYTGAKQVREAAEVLLQRQARILGIVYNRADAKSESYHYYKYADYYAAPHKGAKA